MKLNMMKRQFSLVIAGAILTLTSTALPAFAAETSEQLLNNAATPTSLIAQRSRRRVYYRTRCRTIRRIRRRGRIWLVQRCRRYRCYRRYRYGRRCRLIRTFIRRIPGYYRR